MSDIARGLSNCCRFSGQLPRDFYSVAQHSLLVASLVCQEARIRRAALLHDASEAYLGDMTRNLKHHPSLAGYRKIEKKVQRAIAERFDFVVNKDIKKHIKLADNAAALYEHVTLREGDKLTSAAVQRLLSDGFVKDSYKELKPFLDSLPSCVQRLYPHQAEQEFLDVYAMIA